MKPLMDLTHLAGPPHLTALGEYMNVVHISNGGFWTTRGALGRYRATHRCALHLKTPLFCSTT